MVLKDCLGLQRVKHANEGSSRLVVYQIRWIIVNSSSIHRIYMYHRGYSFPGELLNRVASSGSPAKGAADYF